MNKKTAEEAQAREKELREALSQKDKSLGHATKRAEELEAQLAKERADSGGRNASW
jgi:phage regulator Rha-like protein